MQTLRSLTITLDTCLALIAANSNRYKLTLFLNAIYTTLMPVVARSTLWVCARSPAWIAGSNPVRGLDVCLLCVVKNRTTRRADHLSRSHTDPTGGCQAKWEKNTLCIIKENKHAQS
jgi:hypothetical protein